MDKIKIILGGAGGRLIMAFCHGAEQARPVCKEQKFLCSILRRLGKRDIKHKKSISLWYYEARVLHQMLVMHTPGNDPLFEATKDVLIQQIGRKL